MGLFDGVRRETGRSGASADIAARYGGPSCSCSTSRGRRSRPRQSRSAAPASIRGSHRRRRPEQGGERRHRRLVEDGLARSAYPVLGALTRDPILVLPERHLGLVQAGETADLDGRLDRLADAAERSLDLDRIVRLADAAPGPPRPARPGCRPRPAHRPRRRRRLLVRLPALLAGWRAAGAMVRTFSPLADEPPPDDCDACWLPGGYPELHAERLAAAAAFLGGLRAFARTRPVHGECGGYMEQHQLSQADEHTPCMGGLI